MLTPVNLRRALDQASPNTSSPATDLNSLVHSIWQEEDEKRMRVAVSFQRKNTKSSNAFNLNQLETRRIYSLDTIKKVCTDYRLRFLDVRYFKPEIPEAAVDEIRSLEKQHGIAIEGMKVMAPSKLFRLEDKDDPLLFAPIGNGYYYLIHQWGNDLHPLRKLMVWPMKGMIELALSLVALSLALTLLIPTGFFSKEGGTAEFWLIFFFVFKCVVAIALYYGFARSKNFNPFIWNSKYFNA
jgi:hypothetical protein